MIDLATFNTPTRKRTFTVTVNGVAYDLTKARFQWVDPMTGVIYTLGGPNRFEKRAKDQAAPWWKRITG